jgi:hypothetical protein
MNRHAKILACVVCLIASMSMSIAAPEECREAVDQYKTAISELKDALRTYTICVSDNRGRDDCSSEFLTLQLAQGDFESAVVSYQDECQ